MNKRINILAIVAIVFFLPLGGAMFKLAGIAWGENALILALIAFGAWKFLPARSEAAPAKLQIGVAVGMVTVLVVALKLGSLHESAFYVR